MKTAGFITYPILTGRTHPVSAGHFNQNKGPGPLDGIVDMALGSKMNAPTDIMLFKQRQNQFFIINITLLISLLIYPSLLGPLILIKRAVNTRKKMNLRVLTRCFICFFCRLSRRFSIKTDMDRTPNTA